jgi:hypothetical protein
VVEDIVAETAGSSRRLNFLPLPLANSTDEALEVTLLRILNALREASHVQNILVAIDLNDETASRKSLFSAVELARTFVARLHILTVVREVEALLRAKTVTPS